MLTDYSTAFANCAVFTPSIRYDFSVKTYGDNSLKRVGLYTSNDLNFLNPASSLYFYPYALYSATNQTSLFSPNPKDLSSDFTLPVPTNSIVYNRDVARTTLLGDSGGYSVATSAAGAFNGEDMVRRVLNWLEYQFDYSAALDIPTWAIQNRNIDVFRKRFDIDKYISDWETMSRMNEDYCACLYLTLAHNIIYMDHCHRIGDPELTDPARRENVARAQSITPSRQFLNVVQGRNLHEALFWYKQVKQFPFQNWAFAGDLTTNIEYLSSLFKTMRDDHTFKSAVAYSGIDYSTLPTNRDCQWIHLLGNQKGSLAVQYTSLMRAINTTLNTSIGVSFDSITYSLDWTSRVNKLYTGFYFDEKKGWNYLSAAPSHYADANHGPISLRDWIHFEADREFA